MSLSSHRHLRAARSSPAPAQAMRVGYSTLIFEDDFISQNSIDTASLGTANFNWYVDGMSGWEPLPANNIRVANSILTLTQSESNGVNYGLCTTSAQSTNGRAFRHFYAEARIRFSSTNANYPSGGWPSFWSLSTDMVTTPNAEQLMTHWAELDFFEYTTNAYNGSVHDWYHTNPTEPKTDYVNNNTNYAPLPGVDLSQWHTYGCLWTVGTIQYFFDNKLILTTHYSDTTPPPEHPTYPVGTWSQLDREPNGMSIILGSGNDWPLDVDWVRVWGKPESLLRFDTHSPNPRLPFNAPFELDTQGFRASNSAVVAKNTSEYHSGTASLQLIHSSDIYSSAFCEIIRGLTPGAVFSASCWIKSMPGGADARLIIHFFTARRDYLGNVSAQVTPNGTWQQLTVTGTLPLTIGLISVTVDKPGNSSAQSTVYIDDLAINYI